ncbi:MAG: hypothetical protein HY664_04180 [Chloroflexi bacterium]|nr:hypothetical protein [Chloroflexota bacterium]
MTAVSCGGSPSSGGKEPTLEATPAVAWELSFDQEGGITGFQLSAVIRSSGEAIFRDLRTDRQVQMTLAEPEISALVQLIDASDFFSQPEGQRTPQCRDCINYTLTLWRGDKTHEIHADDLGLADDLRPLVEWLTEHTQQAVQSR